MTKKVILIFGVLILAINIGACSSCYLDAETNIEEISINSDLKENTEVKKELEKSDVVKKETETGKVVSSAAKNETTKELTKKTDDSKTKETIASITKNAIASTTKTKTESTTFSTLIVQSKTQTTARPTTTQTTSRPTTVQTTSRQTSAPTTVRPTTTGTTARPTTTPTTAHTHNWQAVYKTVTVPEKGHYEQVLVTPAWTEEVPIMENVRYYYFTADGYKAYTVEQLYAHEDYLGNNNMSAHWQGKYEYVQVGTEYVDHPAEYQNQWVVDRPATTKQELDYYKCSCGATK